MTFFNKKTEVMNVELTPYGRYLYSIGKLKPKYYEFVDDDILYRASGSTEKQEESHQRIMKETPKFKPPTSFQKELFENQSIQISDKRKILRYMDQKQNGLFAMGRSSYSSDMLPNFQVTMLQGEISGSQMTYQVTSSTPIETTSSVSGTVFIPQVNIDITAMATLKDILDGPITGQYTSQVFSDGKYIEVSLTEPIIHMKEFNSFYEKENFEFEVMINSISGTMRSVPMRSDDVGSLDGIIFNDDDYPVVPTVESGYDYLDSLFDIVKDEIIPSEKLCEAVEKLEINSHFLDEELICPDQRTERFNIYSTNVGPDDLEDC
jgi:hypothetical protein